MKPKLEQGIKERPIIFSGEMVRAILDGRKTQTRRIVKPQPVRENINGIPYFSNGFPIDYRNCPYGQMGDSLWVRETFGESGLNRIEYKAYPKDGKDFRAVMRWKPSIHMPRWASRITLEIVNVRVERLNDISEEDCLKEGVTYWPHEKERIKERFSHLWQSIYGQGSWGQNPWVWVIEFKRVTPPERNET
jgi:hypothetical protein